MNTDTHRSTRFGLAASSLRLCFVAVLLFASTGCQSFGKVGTFSQHMVDYFRGDTALNAAKKMEDTYFPDERREGIIRLADREYGRRDPYTQRYQQIAQFDSDWLVRATAIRMLNRSRDASATSIFVKALEDTHPIVRVEAAKALKNIPDQNAIPVLLRLVADNDQDRDVRIWSAAALGNYKTPQVAQALATQLGSRDFSIAWESRRSLIAITGRDMRYDRDAWTDYLNNEKPFG